MKDPSQPDLRSVSAYSVYNGLAGGLKSYPDHGTTENKRKRKKNAKNKEAKVEKVEKDIVSKDKKSVNQDQKSINGKQSNGGAAHIIVGNDNGTNGVADQKMKKRKKKKKNQTLDTTPASNSTENSVYSILDSDDDREEEVRPAKATKLMVPNPLAGKNVKAVKSQSNGHNKSVEIMGNGKTRKKAIVQFNAQSSELAKSKKQSPSKKTASVNEHDKVKTKTSLALKASKENTEQVIIESKVPPPDIKSIFQNNCAVEDSVAHGKEVLEWLIHPVSADEFKKKYWEKRPVLVKRKHEAAQEYFKWMLTTQSFDSILRRNTIKFGVNLDVTSYENGVRETLSDNLQGRVRPAVVWDYYNNGCSIRMLNPQTYSQQIWKVNSSLQEWFGSFVGANMYLTPPNSQGFAPHYDDIEAFILQVEGKKQWKVYAPRSEDEKLPRFSSTNFSEEKDHLGEPVLDVVLEEGDVMYFPRGWIHQAKTVEGEHSLHITLSCQQLNSFGDLLKHHVNHALDKLMATDVSFREGLPTDYLSFMGIVHQNTENPELIGKRREFSNKVKSLVSKLANVSSDFAADAMGKKFIWDSLPPFYTRKERETCVLEDGEFIQEGRVFNRVEFGPEVEIKLVRKNCVRLVVEEAALRLYYSTENSMVYHDHEPQFLEVGIELAPAINHLITQYPQFTKIEDLPLSSEDIGQKIQIVTDLWERGLILTKEPLEPCDDDIGLADSGDDDEEDVESINLSDLPAEEDSVEDEGDSSEDDEFYDTTLGYDVEDSDSESVSDEEVDDGQADLDNNFFEESDVDFEEEESEVGDWGDEVEEDSEDFVDSDDDAE